MKDWIIVIGSLNLDVTVRVLRLPRTGETVRGKDLCTTLGGKGGNQASAAARLGGRVKMVGRVGDDTFAERLKEGLRAVGIDVSGVNCTKGVPSGMALISLDENGQNQIVATAGANEYLSTLDVETALSSTREGYLLLQLESPLETVAAAAAFARRRGLTTVLDPAPAQVLPKEILNCVDILTPNESEAMTIVGRKGSSVSLADAAELAATLCDLGVGTVVLKLGANGAVVAGALGSGFYPAPKVCALDTTAAGDTFNGALVVALGEGRSFSDAIVFASAAAALSVTRLGAQSSMPSRVDLETSGLWFR